MKRYLILGAGGFIGKELVRSLAKKYKVRALDRKIFKEFINNENIEMVVGNFSKTKDFSEVLQGIDTVIHLISSTVPTDDTSSIPQEINDTIIPTIYLLESMVKCGVNKILFASSGGTVYGETGKHINSVNDKLNPQCGYGVQKKVIESYLQFYGLRYGLDYRIMRITNPYGWGQDSQKLQGLIPIFVNKNLNDEPITIYGDGSNMRDYIFIQDLIEGIIKVDEYSGKEKIFNLGYGESYSINEIVRLIEKLTSKSFASITNVESRFCDVHESYVNVQDSQKVLNWKPKISLEHGLTRTIEYLKI